MLPWAELLEGRLALNLGSFFLCSKAFSGIILIILFWASNHLTCRQKELKLKCFLSFQNLNSNLALNLGYLNPALNNLALGARGFLSVVCSANWTAKWRSRSRLHCSIFAANNRDKKTSGTQGNVMFTVNDIYKYIQVLLKILTKISHQPQDSQEVFAKMRFNQLRVVLRKKQNAMVKKEMAAQQERILLHHKGILMLKWKPILLKQQKTLKMLWRQC